MQRRDFLKTLGLMSLTSLGLSQPAWAIRDSKQFRVYQYINVAASGLSNRNTGRRRSFDVQVFPLGAKTLEQSVGTWFPEDAYLERASYEDFRQRYFDIKQILRSRGYGFQIELDAKPEAAKVLTVGNGKWHCLFLPTQKEAGTNLLLRFTERKVRFKDRLQKEIASVHSLAAKMGSNLCGSASSGVLVAWQKGGTFQQAVKSFHHGQWGRSWDIEKDLKNRLEAGTPSDLQCVRAAKKLLRRGKSKCFRASDPFGNSHKCIFLEPLATPGYKAFLWMDYAYG